MKWTPGGVSEDVEDRRGEGGGGLRGGPVGIGVVLVLLVLSLLTGKNFLSLLDTGAASGGSDTTTSQPAPTSPQEERLVSFVSFVLDDAQATWAKLMPGEYRKAKLVLFRDAIDTACGVGQTASGPFYCPGDEKVYIDLGFYDELKQRFGASGDFAQAYVIAHELGHHVQKLRGIEGAGPSAAAGQTRGSKRLVGEAGAAGRLLRRHLGPLHRRTQDPGSGRRRIGAERGGVHR